MVREVTITGDEVTITKTSKATTRRLTYTVKRWALLLTCLSSRAVHRDVLESMHTNLLSNAFRRFVCLRGRVNIIHSDQGCNFMRARKDLGLESVEVDT